MARIVIADDGIRFDGRTPETSPLGGAESAVVSLAEALAARGHAVRVVNKCAAPLLHNGVNWSPISDGFPDSADLYIANRGDKLIRAMPKAGRTAFWVHNPASYLLKWRYLWKLWRVRPPIVFVGDYHRGTYPAWAPDGGRVVIPLGLPESFRRAEPAAAPPPPRAIFTSNPLRGLDWLLDLWRDRIHPAVPEAELHVFSGAATYGSAGEAKAEAMRAVLEKAKLLHPLGVILRQPVRKAILIEELRSSRVFLYRGDVNETFCYAVAEAQALGVPCVVKDIGSMRERVVDGETGYVCADTPAGDSAFAQRAVELLGGNDADWRAMQARALNLQRRWGWDEAAERWEALMGRPE